MLAYFFIHYILSSNYIFTDDLKGFKRERCVPQPGQVQQNQTINIDPKVHWAVEIS